MSELDDPYQLNRVMDAIKKRLRVTNLHKSGNGLEFVILRGTLGGREVAIKIPRDRVFSNVNDTHIESRTLLDQEFALMRHVKMHGIVEVPDPIDDFEAAGFGVLVMSFVHSDGSKPNEYNLGQLLARIHKIEAPRFNLSAQENEEIPELIPHRLNRRWGELKNFVPDLPKLPPFSMLKSILEETRDIKQLLHMDFREANLRTKDEKVAAVVDWSNALVGHPALELARVAETGEVGRSFLQGYAAIAPLPTASREAEILFRLDTATMLALVFLSEAPDRKRAPLLVRRVQELSSEL